MLPRPHRARPGDLEDFPGFFLRCNNDRNWTAHLVCSRFEEITGYSAEDLTSQSVDYSELIHPDDREDVWAKVQQAIAKGEPWALTYRLITRLGHERWVWERGRPVTRNGEITHLDCFVTDVTDLRQVSSELRRTQEDYRRLIEQVPCAICETSADGRILLINPRAADLLAQRPEQLVGRRWQDVFLTGIQADSGDDLFAALRAGDLENVEAATPADGGLERMIRWQAHVQRRPDGRVVDVTLIGHDVTDQSRTRRMLRQTARHFRMLVAHSTDPFLVLDSQGRINYASPALSKSMGMRTGVLIGSPVTDLIHPDDRDLLRGALESALANPGKIVTRTHRVGHHGGAVRWFESQAHAVPIEGQLRVVVNARDVTEQRGIENALRESRRRYQDVIEQLPGAVYTVAIEGDAGTVSFVSPQIEEITGYPPSAFQQDPDLGERIILEEDHPRARAAFVQGLGTDRPFLVEYRIRRPDGDVRWLRNRGRRICDDAGRPAYVQGMVTDITEMRAAEAREEELLARIHAVYDHAPIAFALVALDGAILQTNAFLERMLGYESGQLLEMTWRDITHPDDLAAEDAQWDQLLTGELHVYEREKRYIRSDGQIVWGRLTATLHRPVDGTAFAIGVVQDITDRKRAEQSLTESEETYKALVEGMPDVVMRLDREGRYLFCSSNIEGVTGLAPSQFIGRTPREMGLFPEQLLAFWERTLDRVFQTRESAEEEFPLDIRGRTTVYNWRVIPEFDADGTVRSALSLSRDVTEHRRTEREYSALFEKMLNGFALHEIICDDDGRPVDYRFLTVNPAFEQMTGLSADRIVGKRIRDVLPQTEPEWIETYGRVALTGEPASFESYARSFDKHFAVTAFRPAPGQFACIVDDLTERKRLEAERQHFGQRYEAIVQNARVAIGVADSSGRIVEANESLCRMLGYEPGEMLGLTVMGITAAEDRSHADRAFQETLAGQRDGYMLEKCYLTRDGRRVWGHVIGSAIEGPDGERHIIAAIHDITERREAEDRMRRMQRAMDDSPDWVAIVDRSRRFEYINDSAVAISGYSREELLGGEALLLREDNFEPGRFDEVMAQLTAGESVRAVLSFRTRDGQRVHLDHTFAPMRDSAGEVTHIISTGKNITQEKELEARLNRLANYDLLTGLPNRSLFLDRVEHMLVSHKRSGRQAALLLIDVDRFKYVNDRYGVDVGDKVLSALADRMNDAFRKGDIVARLTGNQFGVALAGLAQSEDAILVLRKLISAMDEPLVIGENRITLTISVGVAVYPGDGDNALELLTNAEVSLDHGRTPGRQSYEFFTPDMNRRALEYGDMEQRLRDALRNEEFQVHYQPYYGTANGNLVGMEALLRWHNVELGNVPPGRFIPVLEESGMIAAVGEYVFEQVARQIVRWADDGRRVVPVSVNLSPVQFRDRHLLPRLASILDQCGCEPRNLAVEITEGTFMADVSETHHVLGNLKDMGMSIYVDDFGTGYSSLRYLKQLPIDGLKIDMSFIRDVTTDADDASIVTAIISMAHQLQLVAIAEGVETDEQLRVLRLLRCDLAQGFFLGRPAPADRVVGLLQAAAEE